MRHATAEMLSGYLDGDLGPAERAELETHLQGCEPCRERLAGLNRVVARLQALERAAPPPELGRKLERRLAIARRPRGLIERVEDLLQHVRLEPSLASAFALVLAFAAILILFAHGLERELERRVPLVVPPGPPPPAQGTAAPRDAAAEAPGEAPERAPRTTSEREEAAVEPVGAGAGEGAGEAAPPAEAQLEERRRQPADESVEEQTGAAAPATRRQERPLAALDSQTTRVVGDRAFVLGDQGWRERAVGDARPSVRVELATPEGRVWRAAHPELEEVLALGGRIVLRVDGEVIEVVAGGETE